MTGDPRRPPQSISSPASGTSCGRHRQRCVRAVEELDRRGHQPAIAHILEVVHLVLAGPITVMARLPRHDAAF